MDVLRIMVCACAGYILMYHFHGKYVGSLILSRAGNDEQADGVAQTATVAPQRALPPAAWRPIAGMR